MDLNHPKQKLLFFVAQDIDDTIRGNIRDFVLRLAAIGPWLNGPPRFVCSREELDGASHTDVSNETIGGYIEIHSALPPWTLPTEIDREYLNEVTALVNAIMGFSQKHNLTIEFELDGTFVGTISAGKTDHCLEEGLIGEWRRNLDGR